MEFSRVAFGEVASLLLLDCIIVALFLGAAVLIEKGGVELPQPIHAEWTPGQFFVLAVLLAPPFEEWLFRAGLLGNRKTLIGVAVGWTLFIGLMALAVPDAVEPWHISWVLPVGIAAGITTGAFMRRDRSWPTEFGRSFPYLFWLSSSAFALVHLSYYEAPLALMTLVMVIPYLTGGTILAYSRVTYGMWANLAQHATYNGLILALHVCWPDQFSL